MKCKECSKEIPNGFTDCPWCGAAVGSGVAGAASGTTAAPAQNLLMAISIVTSGLLFVVLNYFAATRTSGPLTLEHSGYFLGRIAASLVLGALLVFGYCKFAGKVLRKPLLALIILTLSSLFTMMSLAIPARTRLAGIDPATVRRYSDAAKVRQAPATPVNQTKWDPAARLLMKDVQARNQQYISEISTLDETSKPLYTPQSFHDAAAIQQMIDQLHVRLTVADKYTDWQPIFSKMKGYVAAVDTSEEEKRKFMQQFDASLPKTLAVCKLISDKEHAWLQSSLDLYQFALAKEGAFVWQPDNLVFKNHSDSGVFRQKFIRARTLNNDFLQAYWQVRQAQAAMMAQLGLPDAEADPPQPK
jgi:hypothetical protein